MRILSGSAVKVVVPDFIRGDAVGADYCDVVRDIVGKSIVVHAREEALVDEEAAQQQEGNGGQRNSNLETGLTRRLLQCNESLADLAARCKCGNETKITGVVRFLTERSENPSLTLFARLQADQRHVE